ncbi:hypothetical protein ACFQ7N_10315 [Streptomyces niveus]|uniref:DNA polymerase Y family protein n=1 Tax=Streptomyces niveus TaxID=193462 RepID=UPI00367B3C4F
MSAPPPAVLHLHFHQADQNAELYEQLLVLIGQITPRVQALPPDAAALELSGAYRYFDRDPRSLAQLVQLRCLALYGVRSTAAVAGNRMLAAMACTATPPGNITVLPDHPYDIAAFLRPRPVAALPGIGPATARTLARFGLTTIGALADTPLLTVQRLLGTATGRTLHTRAHGHDPRPVIPQAPPRTATADHRFNHDELNPDQHRRALLTLATELGARLRADSSVTRALTLTTRFADRTTTTRTRSMAEPTAHSPALTATTYALYEALGLQRARVRVLSLRAEDLTPAEHATQQLTFDPRDDRARRAEAAADRARARFGPHAVIAAGSLTADARTRPGKPGTSRRFP